VDNQGNSVAERSRLSMAYGSAVWVSVDGREQAQEG
jgi:hypothetical protein